MGKESKPRGGRRGAWAKARVEGIGNEGVEGIGNEVEGREQRLVINRLGRFPTLTRILSHTDLDAKLD